MSAITHRHRTPIMLKEIHAAPERVEILLARETDGLDQALARFRGNPPPLIFVAGRGTSDNAAVFGRYVFEHFAGIPVSGAALSLFTLYPAPMHLKATEVGRLAAAAGCGQVVLTHLYPQVEASDPAPRVRQHYGGPVRVAEDGLLLQIG